MPPPRHPSIGVLCDPRLNVVGNAFQNALFPDHALAPAEIEEELRGTGGVGPLNHSVLLMREILSEKGYDTTEAHPNSGLTPPYVVWGRRDLGGGHAGPVHAVAVREHDRRAYLLDTSSNGPVEVGPRPEEVLAAARIRAGGASFLEIRRR